MPIPIAILESNAVVLLSGIFKNPIIPKLIRAVMIIGTDPIRLILKLLNIMESRTITINNDIKRL